MAVVAQDIIDATRLYVPANNTIPQEDMLDIADKVIAKYGDDDANLNKISCEFLKHIAIVNSALYVVSSGGLKREKLGAHEVEYFSDSGDNWDDFLKKVEETICPLIFGVTGKFVHGATVKSSPEEPIIKVNNWIL